MRRALRGKRLPRAPRAGSADCSVAVASSEVRSQMSRPPTTSNAATNPALISDCLTFAVGRHAADREVIRGGPDGCGGTAGGGGMAAWGGRGAAGEERPPGGGAVRDWDALCGSSPWVGWSSFTWGGAPSGRFSASSGQFGREVLFRRLYRTKKSCDALIAAVVAATPALPASALASSCRRKHVI